jgi:EpsI family protein
MLKETGLLRSALTGSFLAGALLLVAQAAAMHMLALPERELPTPPLGNLPAQLGSWKLQNEQALEPAVLEYLKPDSYVLRDYGNATGNAAINLFVAYFKSLQNSYGPHSPRVCLPGSGWLVQSSSIRPLPVPGHAGDIPVNEYILEKNQDRILVLYWYQNDRNVWAEEFKAKLTLLPDLIRYRRSDVSLVRLVAPLRGETDAQTLAQCKEFARLIFPSLADSLRKGE